MKYLAAVLFIVSCAVSFGQDTIKVSTKDTAAYMVVEVEAKFPGGTDSMMRFISRNLIYPADAIENEIEGKVIVSFIVETDGSLSGITIKRGLGYGCDKEVIRVIKAMPPWKPAEQKGKKVRVMMTLPVIFRLN